MNKNLKKNISMIYIVRIFISGTDSNKFEEVVRIKDALDNVDAIYLAIRKLREENILSFNFIGKENSKNKLSLCELLSNKCCLTENCNGSCEEIDDNLLIYERRNRCKILKSYLEVEDGFISDSDYENFLGICKYIKCEYIEDTDE